MCDNCYVLRELFKAVESNLQQNYIPTLAFMKEMVRQERIELFAGDCPIEEAEELLLSEMHYTVCHYFKCKSCNKYFFIGACIRGVPIFKTMDNLDNVNLDNMLWGHYGILYQHNS